MEMEKSISHCPPPAGAKHARDYKCPICKTYPPDDEYMIHATQYPKIYNHHEGSTMDGRYNNWDELHRCEDCGTQFWFTNGEY